MSERIIKNFILIKNLLVELYDFQFYFFVSINFIFKTNLLLMKLLAIRK